MANTEQGRLWIRLVKKHRVEKSLTAPCSREGAEEALRELLPQLDLSQPVWMDKHRADWEEYAMTRFLPEHFLEPVPFDSLEISYIAPENAGKPYRKKNPLEDA